jgi:hypothetical protein
MMSNAGIHGRARGLHLGLLAVVATFWLLVLSASVSLRMPTFINDAVAFLSFCPYRRFTGQACPLCGGLSAFVLLMNGDLKSALSSNTLAVTVAPMLVIQFFYRLLRTINPVLRLREEIGVFVMGGLLGTALAAIG